MPKPNTHLPDPQNTPKPELEKLMDAEIIKLIILVVVFILLVLSVREAWLTSKLNKKTQKILREIEAMSKLK